MSQDDPKNSGTADDQAPQETSRRRFIQGSVAAVGAMAVAAIPTVAEAHCLSCSPVLSEEMEGFARVAVKAWSDPSYRTRLLSFAEGKPLEWNAYTASQRSDMLLKTRKAFEEEKVTFPKDVYPVVLSQQQFERGAFSKQDAAERVLQLPDAPKPAYSLLSKGDVRLEVAKYSIDVHICGM